MKSGKLLRRITGLEKTSSCLAFAPEGKRLAVGNLQRLWVQLFDVTSGSNGNCGGSYLCTAKIGYDGPSGLGAPKGTAGF